MATPVNSCTQNFREMVLSPGTVGAVVVLAVALAVIGGLAYAGTLNPSGHFGVLAPIGQFGSGIMLGGGGVSAILLLFFRIVWGSPQAPAVEQQLPQQREAEDKIKNPTGADDLTPISRRDGHPNASFKAVD